MDQFSKYYWLIAAAASGAFVSGGLDTTPRSAMQRLTFFLSGLACAFWLADPAARYLGVVEPGQIAAITFCFAAFWPRVMARISNAIDAVKLAKGEPK